MANCVIGHADRVLGKFVQASSEALGYPSTNVGVEHPSQPWRTQDGVTSAFVLIDFGSLQNIAAVAAIATNLSAAATWRVRLSTVDATGVAGNAHDSGTISAGVNTLYRMAVRIFSSTASGRYFQSRFHRRNTTVPRDWPPVRWCRVQAWQKFRPWELLRIPRLEQTI